MSGTFYFVQRRLVSLAVAWLRWKRRLPVLDNLSRNALVDPLLPRERVKRVEEEEEYSKESIGSIVRWFVVAMSSEQISYFIIFSLQAYWKLSNGVNYIFFLPRIVDLFRETCSMIFASRSIPSFHLVLFACRRN